MPSRFALNAPSSVRAGLLPPRRASAHAAFSACERHPHFISFAAAPLMQYCCPPPPYARAHSLRLSSVGCGVVLDSGVPFSRRGGGSRGRPAPAQGSPHESPASGGKPVRKIYVHTCLRVYKRLSLQPSRLENGSIFLFPNLLFSAKMLYFV